MKKFLLLLLIICLGSFKNSFTQDYKQNKTLDPLGEPGYTHLNINNISTFFYNDGRSDIDLLGNGGFYFPKGSKTTAVFQSGLVWGAKVNSDTLIRIGGSAYRTGLQGGKIISNGIAEDPKAEHVRIYRVRRDIYPGGPYVDFSAEVKGEEKTAQQIRDQYEKDWMEWRAIDGAPFDDQNVNGIYEPTIDIPGFPGADQTIWFVANDLNPAKTTFLYGTKPLGIELQVTAWSYSTDDYLNDMLFRKYMMINKSTTVLNDVYVSMWSDADLGDAGDDIVGCDTILNLGFTYNSDERDDSYFPSPPPAVGFKLLKGPAISNNKSLSMTAFYFMMGGDPNFGEPSQGEYNGAVEFYNLLQGKIGITGKTFIDPTTNQQTKFPFSGNPITQYGWIDGIQYPSGDRKCGIASGPLQMAVGDTQEIIIAEIAAMGTDRLNSVKRLKDYAVQAQDYYNSGFTKYSAPKTPQPVVKVKGTISKIRLDWGEDIALNDLIENYNKEGYKFQGYNVYQLSSHTSAKEKVKRIATFDIVDGITEIHSTFIDPITGLPVDRVEQFGSDSGIKRTFSTDFDYIENSKMLIGKEYYFAVTAYTFNSDPSAIPNNSESLIRIITVTYYDNYPGPDFGDIVSVNRSTESEEATIKVTVEDPTKLTGDTYEVFFTEQDEVRNQNGDWVAASIIKKTKSPNDLTGSSISIAATYADNLNNGIELTFKLDLISPTNSWADGIKIIFPSNVTVISALPFEAGGGNVMPEIAGNVVSLGLVNGEHTQNGIFHKDEEWKILVSSFTPPISVDWIVYDDGYNDPVGPVVNAEGTTSVQTIGFLTRHAKYWNVRDVTKDTLVLENQTIVNGKYLFPPRDDFSKDVDHYPGPVTDGVRIEVDLNYQGPINFSSIRINGRHYTFFYEGNSPSAVAFVMSNYSVFSGTISSKAIDNFGIGTSDVTELKQDYELRFTGIWDSSLTTSGQKIYFIKEGGQMATIFSTIIGANGLATHPLNPNPGTNNPFLIRIPFEVWNKDKNIQVNLMIRDRIQTSDANPFYAWNPNNRMYGIIVNSPYDKNTAITLSPSDLNNSKATWVLVFWSTHSNLDDTITIKYPNPIQIGVDKFTFTTPKPIKEIGDIDLDSYLVYQNYPNPFNPGTKIRFYLPEAGLVKIEVFNILGQRVSRLSEKEFQPGVNEIDFDGSSLASGMYIYTIEIKDKFFEAKKMLLLK